MKPWFNMICALMFAAGTLAAQAGPAGEQTYIIIAGTEEGGEDTRLLREMELRFALYNQVFRFDPDTLNAPLRVRAFGDKDAYDLHVSSQLGKTVDGAVYIHYAEPDRRELALHRGAAGQSALPYQAFVQYLRAFIPQPPPWIRDGFGVYFNTVFFNADTGELEFEENLAWLEAVKAQGAKAPSLESILMAGASEEPAPAVFQPAAWALVSFFMNSGGEGYFRTLTELFMALSPSASAGENAEAVYRHITRWNGAAALEKDCRAYLMSRKSFADWVREGQRAYTAKRAEDAGECFLRAREMKPAHYLPYYYLGLLAYDRRDYADAEARYRAAGEYGADRALISYALGLNAAAWGKTSEAVSYLEAALAANPGRYRNRAGDLIKRLR
ncbi:MAG: hypothetical protein LBD08_07110 [Treponema sp.]|jgi:tetratricopeptide (TPR) repeat protein|nr:hypothetical protein [Treponema sp.]